MKNEKIEKLKLLEKEIDTIKKELKQNAPPRPVVPKELVEIQEESTKLIDIINGTKFASFLKSGHTLCREDLEPGKIYKIEVDVEPAGEGTYYETIILTQIASNEEINQAKKKLNLLSKKRDKIVSKYQKELRDWKKIYG